MATDLEMSTDVAKLRADGASGSSGKISLPTKICSIGAGYAFRLNRDSFLRNIIFRYVGATTMTVIAKHCPDVQVTVVGT